MHRANWCEKPGLKPNALRNNALRNGEGQKAAPSKSSRRAQSDFTLTPESTKRRTNCSSLCAFNFWFGAITYPSGRDRLRRYRKKPLSPKSENWRINPAFRRENRTNSASMPMCHLVLNVGRPGVKLPDAEMNAVATFVERKRSCLLSAAPFFRVPPRSYSG